MIEEVLPNFYKVEVPLPKNPLKATNSYILKTSARNLIIDTGMNREECLTVLQAALIELAVDLKKTDFFITHLHADHVGLVLQLAATDAKIYFSQPDADILNYSGLWEEQYNLACLNGFPEDELRSAIRKHPGYKYSPKGQVDFTIIKEGDTIESGDYLFQCIETPGHTPGHLCLYESGKKIFLSGDHILADITPNISSWSERKNPLKEYLESLEKIYAFDIALVLPGHRSIIKNCKQRIQELEKHHRERLAEILSIVDKSGKSAFQIASEMSWDIVSDSWDSFPVSQKWFATGEAIAHLKYLVEKRMLHREIQADKIMFLLN